MFVGSKEEQVAMLIDTMATGTAINYKNYMSNTAHKTNNVQTVTSGQSEMSITGLAGEDEVCIYDFYNVRN